MDAEGNCTPVWVPFSPDVQITVIPRPGFLRVVFRSSDTDPDPSCATAGCRTLSRYQVLDQNGVAINQAGMTIQEAVTSDMGTCHSTIIDAGQWNTDTTGTMIGLDQQTRCCSGEPDCQSIFDQTFTVLGNPVLIRSQDGSITGTHNHITMSCSGGVRELCEHCNNTLTQEICLRLP